jgi:hypothetical protein
MPDLGRLLHRSMSSQPQISEANTDRVVVPIRKSSLVPTQEIVPALSRSIALAVAIVSFLLGMAIALAVRFGDSAPPVREAFLAVDPAPSDLVVRFEGTRAPPPREIELAEQLLFEGRAHLAARRIEDGERLLGLCIRLADLAECHRAFGAILALTQRPGARAHLGLYLERAADAPDREELMSVLGRSK